MGETLRTEEVLFGNDAPVIMGVGETPTISIPDALRINAAVRLDVVNSSSSERYGVPSYCIVPTVSLGEWVEKHPFAGGYGAEHYDGLDYARAVALQNFDQLAQLAGYKGYREYDRDQARIRDGKDPYWRLFDGRLAYDLDTYSGEGYPVPESWEELVGRYGAEDSVVLGYMQSVKEVLRVDALRQFRFLDPLPFLDFGLDTDEVFERKRRISKLMNKFLINRGYKPGADNFAVVDLDSGTVSHSGIDEEGNKRLIVDQQG